MIRLFVSHPLSEKEVIRLSESQTHYLLHVMRRQVGDTVSLFNGRDGEWTAVIQELTKKESRLSLTQKKRNQSPTEQIILCPALIKKEPMDFVFQKATELGVSDIYPLITERTVVSKLNMERTQNLLIEAAEQCERLTVPTLHEPVKLSDLWQTLPQTVQPICLAERGEKQTPDFSGKIYAFCIGPEGGWSPNELALFEHHKTPFWHLGDTILRAETAAIVSVACYRFNR